jgi:hypothetical protein
MARFLLGCPWTIHESFPHIFMDDFFLPLWTFNMDNYNNASYDPIKHVRRTKRYTSHFGQWAVMFGRRELSTFEGVSDLKMWDP